MDTIPYKPKDVLLLKKHIHDRVPKQNRFFVFKFPQINKILHLELLVGVTFPASHFKESSYGHWTNPEPQALAGGARLAARRPAPRAVSRCPCTRVREALHPPCTRPAPSVAPTSPPAPAESERAAHSLAMLRCMGGLVLFSPFLSLTACT